MSDQSQDSKATNARKENASTVIVVRACKQPQVLMLLLWGAPVNLHSCHQSLGNVTGLLRISILCSISLKMKVEFDIGSA